MKRIVFASLAFLLVLTALIVLAALFRDRPVLSILLVGIIGSYLAFPVWIVIASVYTRKDHRRMKFRQIYSLVKTGLGTGLIEIYGTRGAHRVPNFWESFLDQDEPAENDEVVILSNLCRSILRSLYDERQRRDLVKKIKQGWKVRILILDPEGSAAQVRARDEKDQGLIGTPLENVFPTLESVVSDILKETRSTNGDFSFGLLDVTPSCQIIRIGARMLVTNYLCGKTGRYCPTLLLQKESDGQLFDTYMEHFKEACESGTVMFMLFGVERKTLFSVGMSFRSDLDRRNLPVDLQNEFSQSGFTLSPNSTVSVEREGKRWLIADPNSGEEYPVVEKANGRLNIYDPMPWSQLDEGTMPSELKRGFTDNLIHLNSPVVSKRDRARKWLITDGPKEYIVREEKGVRYKLIVYCKPTPQELM